MNSLHSKAKEEVESPMKRRSPRRSISSSESRVAYSFYGEATLDLNYKSLLSQGRSLPLSYLPFFTSV